MKIQQRRATSRWRMVLYILPLLFSLTGAIQGVPKPIWLVVTRPMFLKTLQPLVEHRQKDGFETIVSTEPIETSIKKCPRPPKYLLLVGDDESGKDNEPWYVPAKRIPAAPMFRRKSTQYASDAIYGDQNNDRFPDIPVGRISVRTAKQAETVVRKILTYEAQPPRVEDLDLFIWAGSTMFGEAFDRLASTLLMQIATKRLPDWVEPYIISANRGPLYCCIPDHFEFASHQLEQNPGLILLDGHGWPNLFFLGKWAVQPSKTDYVCCQSDFFLTPRDTKEPMSSMVILACLCGRFIGKKPCMAEDLVNHPGGPVGCIAATVESHALTNLYTAQAMMQTLRQPGRLGDFWLHTLRTGDRIRNRMLETMLVYTESPLCPDRDMDKYRREHTTLYALLGDPATKLRLPEPLACTVQQNADGTWTWTAVKPKDATRLLVTFRAEMKNLYEKPKDWNDTAAVKKAFEKTNKRLSFTTRAEIPAGKSWSGVIDTPGTLRLVALGPKRMHTAAKKITPKK